MPHLLLVSLGDTTRLEAACAELEAAGWFVASGTRDDAAGLVRDTRPALVVLDGETAAVNALARVLHEAASVPVVVLAEHPCGCPLAGVAGPDAAVAAGNLAAALQRWWPLNADPVRERLAAMLGRDNYDGLISRFGVQLEETLLTIDGDNAAAARAHRIAGLAGTLGFAEVCDTWLPLSEGAADARSAAAAAAAARRALQVIAHRPDQNC